LSARRSTTSSTVKPRTFLPPPTSSSTVVPWWVPLEAGGSGWRSARQPSTTVISVPRTFTTPATGGGAPGLRGDPTRGTLWRQRFELLRRPPLRRRDAPAAAARVRGVAHHGVADVRQVHPDLMRPPGVEREAQQVGLGETRHHRCMRHRVATARQHGHPLAI